MGAMQCNDIHELTAALRENGDKILDATSKLSLSTSLIIKMNESFNNILNNSDTYSSPFHVISGGLDQFLDLQLLYDFIQKTVALKVLPDSNTVNLIDLNIFRNLKFLEIHKVSLSLLKGLRNLRNRLEYLICRHSINTLKEVLEYCGADNVNGYVWSELKQATFSHNDLNNLDTSLEFTPWLHSIDLSHNHIHDVHSLNCLPNLKYLNLSFNAIESVPAFCCNALQVLILRNNYIDDVRELNLLVNLYELDLSHNCLMEHDCLRPLMNMALLKKLQLQGNPLSYHPQHRSQTAKYLHINVLDLDFVLDNLLLSKSEKKFVGVLHQPMEMNFDLLFQNVVSSQQDVQGMQDSGFVAEQRPASPSESSIGSATSLERPLDNAVKYCESDIEVLSNPSQSSIEVLWNRSIPRCNVQSTSAILTQPINQISTNNDLKILVEEMHKSL